MLRLFRNYNPYSTILLFLLALVLKLDMFMAARAPFVSEKQLIWNYVVQKLVAFFAHNNFIYTFIAVICIVGQGLYLNYIANKNHIFPKRSYLPAFTYIVITTLQSDWSQLSASLVANWMLVALLSMTLSLYANNNPRKILFNIGCILSIAILLVFSNVFLLPFVFVALIILRPFKIAEWMVMLLGLLTPIYILACCLFLFDSLHLMPQVVIYELKAYKDIPLPILITAATLGFYLLMSLIFLSNQMNRMLYQIKKIWWVIIVFFVFGIMSSLFTFAFSYNQWIVTLLPASLLITQLWFIRKPKWLSPALAWILVGVIVYLQWFLK